MCFEDIVTNHLLMNESVSDEAVCRKAPATPGLLKIGVRKCFVKNLEIFKGV